MPAANSADGIFTAVIGGRRIINDIESRERHSGGDGVGLQAAGAGHDHVRDGQTGPWIQAAQVVENGLAVLRVIAR
jgi:hypothetical protein